MTMTGCWTPPRVLKQRWAILLLFVVAFACGTAFGEETIEQLRARADKGDLQAQLTLAKSYYLGLGVSKDEVEAARWFRRAADQGESQSERILGLMYEAGRAGLPKDDTQAVFWYRRAVEHGDASALHLVARQCVNSTNPKVRDPIAGLDYARKAVAARPNDPEFLSTLAQAYALQGQFAEAVKSQTEAVAFAPSDRKESYTRALGEYQRQSEERRLP
jgi:hypothetical protein